MAMRVRFCFGVSLLVLQAAMGNGQTGSQSAPIKASLCELAEDPERYAGKIVSVHATEMGKDFWIEDFTSKPCSAYTPVIVAYPEGIKPPPGFDLVRDDAFHRFFDDLREGRHVEATYEGRFDVAYVWREHKRIYIGPERGYGKKNRYGARLVLHRISDVASYVVPRK